MEQPDVEQQQVPAADVGDVIPDGAGAGAPAGDPAEEHEEEPAEGDGDDADQAN